MDSIVCKFFIEDMTWSYSRVKSFSNCPYAWYLKYIRYPDIEKKNLFFANYGKFVHEILADFYSGKGTPFSAKTRYLCDFSKKTSGVCPSKKIWENYFRSGLKYFETLSPLKGKVIGVEEKLDFKISGKPFIGYLDLLFEDEDGRLILQDHKSRTLKPRSNRKKPTKSDTELDDYFKQLYVYSKPVNETRGRYPDVLRLNCFRSNTVIDEDFNMEKYESAMADMADSVKTIERETEFRPKGEYFKCRYLCDVCDQCEFFKLGDW